MFEDQYAKMKGEGRVWFIDTPEAHTKEESVDASWNPNGVGPVARLVHDSAQLSR